MVRVIWTKYVSNDELLKKMERKSKRQLKIIDHMMRKESLGNVIVMEQIDGNRDRWGDEDKAKPTWRVCGKKVCFGRTAQR